MRELHNGKAETWAQADRKVTPETGLTTATHAGSAKLRAAIVRRLLNFIQADALSVRAPAASAPPTGTPQGAVISPLLANIYLTPFDARVSQKGLWLVRYADDFVVLCAKKRDAERGLALIRDTLEDLRLALHPYKTDIKHFDQGFAFLGYFFIRNECHSIKG